MDREVLARPPKVKAVAGMSVVVAGSPCPKRVGQQEEDRDRKKNCKRIEWRWKGEM